MKVVLNHTCSLRIAICGSERGLNEGHSGEVVLGVSDMIALLVCEPGRVNDSSTSKLYGESLRL
jgi:hypothetical protein